MALRAQFLNVDLDLRDESGVRDLVRELEPAMFVLHREDKFASLELSTETTPSLDEVLNCLVDAVETLPSKARDLWNRCQLRSMNVGVKAGSAHAGAFDVPLSTLRRLVTIGAELELTVYPPSGSKPARRQSGRTLRRRQGVRKRRSSRG